VSSLRWVLPDAASASIPPKRCEASRGTASRTGGVVSREQPTRSSARESVASPRTPVPAPSQQTGTLPDTPAGPAAGPRCTSPRGRCCAPVRAHAGFAHIRCRTCRPRSGRCRRSARVDCSGPRGHFWRGSRRTGNRFQFMGPLARLAAPKVFGTIRPTVSTPRQMQFGVKFPASKLRVSRL